jgi:hypothetical protein
MYKYLKDIIPLGLNAEAWEENSDFISFAHTTKGRQIVFFFDEMDAVLYTKYKDEFLSTLRSLQCEPQSHGIKVQLYEFS